MKPGAANRRHAAALALVWIVAVVYLGLRADRGWIPHDEGYLGQSAERVLAGELPHRDFDDPYTGGLAYLHAAAFLAFGVKLTSLRLLLLLASAVFVAAVYAVAARALPPPAAAAATLAAIAWSLPLYFAALPSWYNLFFASFGTLALLRHLDTGRRRWLFAAGLAGGLSFLIKSVALYYVAAALLFLVYREQVLHAESRQQELSAGPARGFRVATASAVVAFAGVVALLVSRSPGPMEIFHFLLPVFALCGLLLWNESQIEAGGTGERWRRLLGLVGPFAAGCLLPVALFLVPYLLSGSGWDLFAGLFLLPQKRFQFATTALPAPWTLAAALPAAALLAAPWLRAFSPRPWMVAAAAAAGAAVVAFGDHPAVHRAVWSSVRPLVPLAVGFGCLLLVRGVRPPGDRDRRGRWRRLPARQRQELFLLLAVAGLVSLVQFPDAFGVYFGYAAPLVVLALARVVASQRRSPRALHAVALLTYLAFAVVWLHRSMVLTTGDRYWPVTLDTRLDVERGGLRVPRRMAEHYRRLVEEIERRSAPGAYIYATPDCPEVYFLAGRRNPTRTLFEFFDDDYLADPRARAARILALLEARRVDVIVLHHAPQFSNRIPPPLLRGIESRYPHRVEVRPYTIRWRPPGPGR